MTTYSYTLTLRDGELIALEEALKFYLAYCDQQLEDGPCSPFWAHRESILKILARRYDNVQLTSWSG
jgi:hypothetical protein